MSLGRIDIVAGDFKYGKESQYLRGQLLMKNVDSYLREKISIGEIADLEQITEENVTSFTGAAGGGIVGGVLLGPVGLLAGLVLGGKRDNKTFRCTFKDGRAFIGTSSAKTFNQLNHALMASSMSRSSENRERNLKKTNKWLHVFLSVVTLGLWLPVWLLLVLINYSHNSKYKN